MDQLSISAIDDCVSSAMALQRIPGIALAIGSNGRVVYARGYGYRNLPEHIEPDDETIFSIASISKQFTATAIMHFVERGALSLEDSLSRFFPALPYPPELRIRHLLTHTSGVPGFTEVSNFDQLARTVATSYEVVSTITGRPLAFAPGEQWQYSNTNYVLLAQLIEILSGVSYEEFLHQRILDVLELKRTGVDDLVTVRENETECYSAYFLGDFEHALEWDTSWRFGTGGLYSTARDLVRWNVGLREGRVISQASVAQMMTSTRLNDGSDAGYGFGFVVGEVSGLREIRHGGGLPGYSLENVTYPDVGLDIVVLSNIDGVGTYLSIVRPLLALLLNRPELSFWTPKNTNSSILRNRQPDPTTWVESARNGRLNELQLGPGLKRFLTQRRCDALVKLSDLGELEGIELLDCGRRDPEDWFSYSVDFEKRRLLAGIAIADGGEIEGISFREWDERRVE